MSEEIIETATGLGYVDLVEGTGATPKSGESVTVHYTGWLKSGEKCTLTESPAFGAAPAPSTRST